MLTLYLNLLNFRYNSWRLFFFVVVFLFCQLCQHHVTFWLFVNCSFMIASYPSAIPCSPSSMSWCNVCSLFIGLLFTLILRFCNMPYVIMDYRLFITLLAPDYFESWHSFPDMHAQIDMYILNLSALYMHFLIPPFHTFFECYRDS